MRMLPSVSVSATASRPRCPSTAPPASLPAEMSGVTLPSLPRTKAQVMGTAERLAALSDEIAKLRTEIAILEEQHAFVAEAAEDARIRALVSETPLADREYRTAREDAERTAASLAEAKAALERLRREQDGLLERLFEER